MNSQRVDPLPKKNTNKQTNKKQKTKKHLDTYNGKHVEWPHYNCQFKQVVIWGGWDEYEMFQLAPTLMGRVHSVPWVKLLQKNSLIIENKKKNLMQIFCPSEKESAYWCEFNRRRKREESVADYDYDLKRLTTHAFPSITLNVLKSPIIGNILAGRSRTQATRPVFTPKYTW